MKKYNWKRSVGSLLLAGVPEEKMVHGEDIREAARSLQGEAVDTVVVLYDLYAVDLAQEIRLQLREQPAVEIQDERLFFRLVKAAFGQRRKTILNSVASGLSVGKGTVEEACREAGVIPGVRAEQLTLEAFASLANALSA